tara:strand:- start:9016 stop:9147 length:132 start_codon:yes stop_codon:yes gene_type:complete
LHSEKGVDMKLIKYTEVEMPEQVKRLSGIKTPKGKQKKEVGGV